MPKGESNAVGHPLIIDTEKMREADAIPYECDLCGATVPKAKGQLFDNLLDEALGNAIWFFCDSCLSSKKYQVARIVGGG